ncbi:MAG: hypothetical protein SFX18_05870 [Pirellulales bacterium]|nr:hypothetical protein [Pirellulales bacterium]
MFKIEHKTDPVLPWERFLWRLFLSFSLGLTLIFISLLVGMWGYHVFEGQNWIDSFLNASMILSGMGPLWNPQTEQGKVFAGIYALYSGFAVLIIAGIAFGPLVHRMLHILHVDEQDVEAVEQPR